MIHRTLAVLAGLLLVLSGLPASINAQKPGELATNYGPFHSSVSRFEATAPPNVRLEAQEPGLKAPRHTFSIIDEQEELDKPRINMSDKPHDAARMRGYATWYCLTGTSACHRSASGGMYAAAGSELRTKGWRGSKVRVCTPDRCVTVTLIDWCACKGDRVIDLYSDAFRELAPLSRGVLRVTVSRT